MRLSLIISCIALVALGSQAAVAQTARAGDKAVSGFMENVQKGVNQFERSLDSKVKNGTIRGATTEVNVENYLKDFNTSIDRMRDRFEPSYSASSEVQAVLKSANGIDRFMKSQSAALKGRSEWDVAAASLNQLATAYGTSFPTPDDAAVRRINDGEIVAATDTVTKQAQAYRKALKGAFTKEESAALGTAQKSADALSTAAKSLKSRIKSGKPASGEAGVVGETFAAAQAAVTGRALPEPAAAAWKSIETAVGTIEQAFGVAKPASQPTAS